jgi:hypothetical protein
MIATRLALLGRRVPALLDLKFVLALFRNHSTPTSGQLITTVDSADLLHERKWKNFRVSSQAQAKFMTLFRSYTHFRGKNNFVSIDIPLLRGFRSERLSLGACLETYPR